MTGNLTKSSSVEERKPQPGLNLKFHVRRGTRNESPFKSRLHIGRKLSIKWNETEPVVLILEGDFFESQVFDPTASHLHVPHRVETSSGGLLLVLGS